MKILMFPLCLSLFVGCCAYVSSNSVWLCLVVAALYFFATLGILSPEINGYAERNKRGHECYRFIHSYVISLSATSSLEKAFYSAQEGANGKLLLTMQTAATLDPMEKAAFMKDYFRSDLYEMFLSVLGLYIDQGGDILQLSGALLEEVNRVEQSSRGRERVAISNTFQYALLWTMATAILIFLRFGLGGYFEKIQTTPIYLFSIGGYFLFMLLSILAYVNNLVDKPKKEGKGKKEKRGKKKAKEEERKRPDAPLLLETLDAEITEENMNGNMEESGEGRRIQSE